MTKPHEQQQLPTPETAPAASGQPEDLTSALFELERLRRENEVLRGRMAQAISLPSERGGLKTYKVHVEGVYPNRSSRSVGPRDNARPEILQIPVVSYDDLDLFLHEAEHDTARLDEAAWKRFIAEGRAIEETGGDGLARTRQVDPVRDRRQFWVGPQHGQRVDHLEIPAHSPADAFALFCKFCGILKTTVQPVVEVVSLDERDGKIDAHFYPVAAV